MGGGAPRPRPVGGDPRPAAAPGRDPATDGPLLSAAPARTGAPRSARRPRGKRHAGKSDVSGGPLMPRQREYQNAAERQAAYRARHRAEEPPLQSYLAGLARTLHGELRDAVA